MVGGLEGGGCYVHHGGKFCWVLSICVFVGSRGLGIVCDALGCVMCKGSMVGSNESNKSLHVGITIMGFY